MTILNKNFDRRDFLCGSAVAASATAMGFASGCSPRLSEAGVGGGTVEDGSAKATVCENDQLIIDGAGEWKYGVCWANSSCGGGCVNRQYVVDGVVVRGGTDSEREDLVECPQWRSCSRGRSRRQNVYGIERLKYPIKRKNWQPGGGENIHGELRGKDEWERITWDEAIEMVGSEIKRIYDTYGPKSVFLHSYYDVPNLFSALGGYVFRDDTVSYGSYTPNCITLGSGYYGEPGLPAMNDRLDLVNAEYIVMTGGNPAWAATGNPMYYFQLARETGTQYAYVGPSYNVSAAALNARWIPVRNGSDTPFWLGVAYEMIRLDEETGDVIDWDFLDTYSVGFDMDHLPQDATVQECFKDYVLGAYDGIPKTPEWASELTGAPVEDFTWMAEVMGKQHKTMLLFSWAAFRCSGSENLAQLMMTVSVMGGHAGKSGHGFGPGLYAQFAANGGEHLTYPGPSNYPYVENPIGDVTLPTISGWRSFTEGSYISTDTGVLSTGDYTVFHEREEVPCDMRMIYTAGGNPIHTVGNGQLRGVEAFRAVDFVCTQDMFCSDTAMMSDVVLPVITPWEGSIEPNEDGDIIWSTNTDKWDYDVYGDINKEVFVSIHPIIAPMFEGRSDVWIAKKLCEKVGLDPEEIFPGTELQCWFDKLRGATYRNPEGEYVPIFNITQETIDKYGVDAEPQNEGVMDLEEFFAKGSFSVPRTDGYVYIKYKELIDDPETNPLTSTSGKFEIYCQAKADGLNVGRVSEEPVKPYANYFVPTDGYVASFEDWEKKTPGAYPFMVSTPHYLRRAHTQNDGATWLREVLENPIFINSDDAAAKGIKTGDTVRIFNDAGQTLRQASVISSIVPGCVALPHGAHFDLDETDPDNPIDRAGSENMIMDFKESNYLHALSGYNTTLVDFEKWEGDPIPRDCERDMAHIDFPEM